jgi:hypothetical protein
MINNEIFGDGLHTYQKHAAVEMFFTKSHGYTSNVERFRVE